MRIDQTYRKREITKRVCEHSAASAQKTVVIRRKVAPLRRINCSISNISMNLTLPFIRPLAPFEIFFADVPFHRHGQLAASSASEGMVSSRHQSWGECWKTLTPGGQATKYALQTRKLA
jgi:hypothetical protein